MTGRFMVCQTCLDKVWGGWEKSCGHGWDVSTGKPRTGTCSECGQPASSLHCPDGSFLTPEQRHERRAKSEAP